MREIHFYSDAPEWGGHEALSARIASALAESGEWSVCYLFYNKQFDITLSPQVRRVKLPYCASTPFPIIRDRSRVKKKLAKDLLQQETPKLLVICPGNIERCLPAVYAATELRIPLVNYLPMGYTQVESGAVLGALRDRFALPIYKRYQQWIVYSDTQESLLRRFIPRITPVHQIPIPLPWGDCLKARSPGKQLRLATIGRIYFGQKGQDIIPPLAAHLKANGVNASFTVLGAGPHEAILKQMIQNKDVGDLVSIQTWMQPKDVRKLLQEDVDALFIPSHFESGPIVLFEALECGIPVIIADADYVKDYQLPSWMIYKQSSMVDAARAITQLSSAWNEQEFQACRDRIFSSRKDSAFREIVKGVFSSIQELAGNRNE